MVRRAQQPWPIGLKIKDVRALTAADYETFGWDRGGGSAPVVIELEDGSILVPSSDPEGNDAGAIFTYDPNTGKHGMLYVQGPG